MTIFTVVIFIALLLVSFYHKGKNTMQFLNVAVILSLGYFNYKLQEEIKEFNRISKIPDLNINKESLETDKVIKIENLSDYPTKNVYIGSFLITANGNDVEILYDEIQSQIIKSYPIEQGDILKDGFRESFKVEDKKEYGTTLRERMQKFINGNSDNEIYLVIALRNYLMTKDETLLFFYECKYSDHGEISSLSFKSKHFSTKTALYKNSLRKITEQYEKHKRKYK